MATRLRDRALPPSLHPAKVDCETIRPHHLIGQPANSSSSLAFCIAGGYVLATCTDERPDDPPRPVVARVLGGSLIAMGVGSVLFHGPGDLLSKWLHDAPILVWNNTMTGWNLYDSALVDGSVAIAGVAGATAAQCVLLAVRPEASVAQGAISASALWATEALIRLARRRELPNIPQRPARLERASLATMLSSGLFQVLGRTGMPLCKPDSAIQPHAIWHVGSAAALAMQSRAATGPDSGPSPRRVSTARPEARQ